jgi:hypothetical protein
MKEYTLERGQYCKLSSIGDSYTSWCLCLQMKDMNYIVQNVSKDSLLIIDELGRGWIFAFHRILPLYDCLQASVILLACV